MSAREFNNLCLNSKKKKCIKLILESIFDMVRGKDGRNSVMVLLSTREKYTHFFHYNKDNYLFNILL